MSTLAEVTREEHRGRGSDTILHITSKINRNGFGSERSRYWKTRANELN